MQRVGFAMQLKPGAKAEYRRRHDAIWPELVRLLREAGIREYVIYLDPQSDTLYASHKLTDRNGLDRLPEDPIMRRWWAAMADLMETNPDASPVVRPLEELFYLE